MLIILGGSDAVEESYLKGRMSSAINIEPSLLSRRASPASARVKWVFRSKMGRRSWPAFSS